MELQHISGRPAEVLAEISNIRLDLMKRSLLLGRLLKEIKDNNYAQHYGYTRFADWVEQGSNLDISSRSAFYLIMVVERSQKLGISDEQLEKSKLSKVKEILALPDSVPDETVKGLITESEGLSLSEVKKTVAGLKNDTSVYKHLKFDEGGADMWDQAVERVRANHGGFKNEQGESTDISESAAAIYMAAEYLAGPSEQDTTPAESEFEDVFITGSESEVFESVGVGDSQGDTQ